MARLKLHRQATTWFALTTLTAIGMGSCGYTQGTGLQQQGIRKVAFQVVGNETYRQRLEVDLSRYLSRQLPVATDLILSDRSSADAVLQVVLTNARERTIVTGRPTANAPPDPTYSRVREGAIEGEVLLRLVGMDGTIKLERRLLDRTEFRAAMGENLTTARNELTEDLARKIALALQTNF